MTRRTFLATTAGLLVGALAQPLLAQEATPKHREIDAATDGAMTRLYEKAKGSKELAEKAQGVLVFPSVKAAGLIVGGEYGEGALRMAGKTTGYYKTAAASIGLTAGAQTKAVYLLFMTQAALDKFRASNGWTAGVDASVALIKVGAGGQLDTATATAPVIGFVLTNAGLMADLSLEGTKVSKLE